MLNFLQLYQTRCPYQITDAVQELDFKFDIDRLRKEMFQFIADNNFKFEAVSLRLPPGQTNYISPNETLESGGKNMLNFNSNTYPNNTTHNKEYTEWHPMLINSYVASLVPELEKLCGFNIGRVRLGWVLPKTGYGLHVDFEPMRLHIPLFTNKTAYIIHDGQMYHMEYGKLYHLITSNLHTAWNFGPLPRLHLIFSTYADKEIDDELDKLSLVELLKATIKDQITNQGIDQYSLMHLFNTTDLSPIFDTKNKKETLYHIRQLLDLLPKST